MSKSLRDRAASVVNLLPPIGTPIPHPTSSSIPASAPSPSPTQQPQVQARPTQQILGEHPAAVIANKSRLMKETYEAAEARAVAAETRLAEYDGALPVRKLDPVKIRPSRWANRHDLSFGTPEFAALREEIASAGGNVQPIKVRPVQRSDEFEIVFGHRRHRACLELGLPVLAMIENVDDRSLWAEMERENRQRADLSPWEQGVHYKRALDEGLFPSQRRMAEAVGMDIGYLSRLVKLANLPAEVVAAFSAPTAIQSDWATALSAAFERDPDGLIERAKQLAEQGVVSNNTPSDKAVFTALTAGVVSNNTPAPPIEIADGEGRAVARIKPGKNGKYSIELTASKLKPDQVEAAIRRLLKL